MSAPLPPVKRTDAVDAKSATPAKVRQLLGAAPTEETRQAWTEFYAREKEIAPTVTHSVVIFRLGKEWLALPTSVFQEIAECSPVHSLPHRRKDTILGLVRVRGELLICVSLAFVLGVETVSEDEAADKKKRFIVLTKNGARFVFPANEVFGIHRLDAELESPPSTVAHATPAFSKGTFQWRGKTIGCLDDAVLFQTLNESLT